MKKIALLFVALLGFAVSSFAMRETVTDTEKISYVISEFYPNLAQYYEEGIDRHNLRPILQIHKHLYF